MWLAGFTKDSDQGILWLSFFSHSGSLQLNSMVLELGEKNEAWKFIYKWDLCDMQQNSKHSCIEKKGEYMPSVGMRPWEDGVDDVWRCS
jgi:hypothetical protein